MLLNILVVGYFLLGFGIVTWQESRVRKAEDRAQFLQSAFNIAISEICMMREESVADAILVRESDNA